MVQGAVLQELRPFNIIRCTFTRPLVKKQEAKYLGQHSRGRMILGKSAWRQALRQCSTKQVYWYAANDLPL